MKKNLFSCLLLVFFLAMLIFSPHTFIGARNGLNLWLFTVTPTLLPYLILSTYMTENGSFRYISRFLSPITTGLFGLSKDCGYIIFLGFFCGYPVGSRLCAEFVKKGYLSRKEGQVLLSFCNNPSPGFLITYLIHGVIGMPQKQFPILFALIGTPFVLGIVLSRFFLSGEKKEKAADHPAASASPSGFDSCIISGFEAAFKLGGYLILFSILGEYLSLLIENPLRLCRIATLTEMTSGLNYYAASALPSLQKLLECSTLTAFGGLCCIAQTHGMIKGSGLSLCLYILARILIATLTFAVLWLIFLF